MVKKTFIILSVIVILHQSKCLENDHLIYEEEEEQKADQGSQQTIHTLKGHYNEEAKRVSKCREKNPSTKNINSKSSIFAQNDSDFLNLKIKSNYNTTQDVNDIEMKVLAEILKDVEYLSRRSNSENEPSKESTNDNSYAIDKTNKQFEFESLLIKNSAPKLSKENREDDKDTTTDLKNNTRRVNLYDDKKAELPQRYYNPFQNLPPRSYTPSDLINPNAKGKILQAYGINYNNSPNPIMKNDKAHQNSAYESTKPTLEATSRYNKNVKLQQGVEDSDTDLFSILNQNSSAADMPMRSDPTKGSGITDMDRSNMMLMHHPRVCYACSSTNDPSCWSPDRRTPTKYCRRDHNACLTKTYIHKGYAFVIRDCGNSCSNRDLADLGIHYRSCTICHYDMCNAADSVRIYATTIVMTLISLIFFKTSV